MEEADAVLPALVCVVMALVLVGAKIIELGMYMVVAVSVPVGIMEAGPCEDVDVVSGAEVVVLASFVLAGRVETGALVLDSLLTGEVDVALDEVGEVSGTGKGTTPVPVSGAVLLLDAYAVGVCILLELNVKVSGRGAVGVIVCPEEAAMVPFDGTVDVGPGDEVSSGIGTTEAPEVLREYAPEDIPVPVRVAVAVALEEASEDAALDRMPENSEDSEEDTAGFVATMLDNSELRVDAILDSASVLETLEICEDMEETTLLMLDAVEDGSRPVTRGSSNPPDSVEVVFGAMVAVGCTITGAVPVDAEVYPVP